MNTVVSVSGNQTQPNTITAKEVADQLKAIEVIEKQLQEAWDKLEPLIKTKNLIAAQSYGLKENVKSAIGKLYFSELA